MRRLLLAALATALLVGASVGVASARLADAPAGEREHSAAPFDVPAAMPAADRSEPGAWGFTTAAALASQYGSSAPASAGTAAAGGASATVTVTATVLPVVIIVLDDAGAVTELVTNTEDRGARDVLFVARRGNASGEPVALDAETWAAARAAMLEARAGTGTVWTA